MAEQKKLKVILIRHTPSPEETVALAAKLCYSKAAIENLKEKISQNDQSAFIEKLMKMGHESVLEHVSFTFGIEGVSRVLLAQLTRHRIASFSVQSQRYVSYENGVDAKYAIQNRIRDYSLTVTERNGITETITGDQIYMQYAQQALVLRGGDVICQEYRGERSDQYYEEYRQYRHIYGLSFVIEDNGA